MSKAKAAAMVLAVIISLLAGCLLIATSASAGNNIKDNTLGLAKIENRQLSNNAATINRRNDFFISVKTIVSSDKSSYIF